MVLLATVARLLSLRRVELLSIPGTPLLTASLWLGGTAAMAAIAFAASGDPFAASASFLALGCAVLAALIAGWLLRPWCEALRLANAFLILAAVALTVVYLAPLFSEPWPGSLIGFPLAASLWAVLGAIRLVYGAAADARARQRLGAVAAIAALFPLGLNWREIEGQATAWYYAGSGSATELARIEPEMLWTAQPGLVAKGLDNLPAAGSGNSHAYVIAIAAGGGQQVFGREAHAVGDLLARRFGSPGQGLLFSNARADLRVAPLAARSNLTEALEAVGESFDSGRDLAVIYLTSHGSADGELQTNLPDGSRLQPITAQWLAKALEQAGTTRRIVIVSACYSGSWIAPLASPDSIVLTASARDRNSFGCDDKQQYTNFAAALLAGPLAGGASLHQAFAELQQRIDREETAGGLRHSLPQADVGARMQDVWNASSGNP